MCKSIIFYYVKTTVVLAGIAGYKICTIINGNNFL